MRRQLGADHVDIDTLISFCGFRLDSPRTIQFSAIGQAAKDALYQLNSVQLIVSGSVRSAACATCGSDRPQLALEGSGQLLELVHWPHTPARGRFVLELQDWNSPHLRAQVVGWEALPD